MACHPLGATRCIWSSKIHDLSSNLKERFGTYSAPNATDLICHLDDACYEEGDLEGALRSGNEVMLHSERFVWTQPDNPAFRASPPLTDEMLWIETLYEGIVGERWVRPPMLELGWHPRAIYALSSGRRVGTRRTGKVLVAIVNDVLARDKQSPETSEVGMPYTITRDLTMVFVNWGFRVV